MKKFFEQFLDKKFITALIAMIAGINVYNAQESETMSDETKRKTDSGVTGYLYKM